MAQKGKRRDAGRDRRRGARRDEVRGEVQRGVRRYGKREETKVVIYDNKCW